MEWTNEKPKVPGLYWLKEKQEEVTIVELVKGWSDHDRLEVMALGDSLNCGRGWIGYFSDKCLWYGPLKPPGGLNDKK